MILEKRAWRRLGRWWETVFTGEADVMKAVGLCLALKGERSEGLLVLSLNKPLAYSVRPPTGLISQVFADVFV